MTKNPPQKAGTHKCRRQAALNAKSGVVAGPTHHCLAPVSTSALTTTTPAVGEQHHRPTNESRRRTRLDLPGDNNLSARYSVYPSLYSRHTTLAHFTSPIICSSFDPARLSTPSYLVLRCATSAIEQPDSTHSHHAIIETTSLAILNISEQLLSLRASCISTIRAQRRLHHGWPWSPARLLRRR